MAHMGQTVEAEGGVDRGFMGGTATSATTRSHPMNFLAAGTQEATRASHPRSR